LAEHPSGAEYASWWARLGAEILDSLVVGIPMGIALSIIGASSNVRTVVIPLALFVYNTLLDGGPTGQTVGKRAAGITARADETAGPLGLRRGAVRSSLVLALAIIGNYRLGDDDSFLVTLNVLAVVDGLWPLWDPRRQSWHDKLAGSVVLRVGEG
jgi:uncharacterized RDD family membrane protein YckC